MEKLTKKCTKCNCLKEITEFRLYKNRLYRSECKECEKITKLIYRRSKRGLCFTIYDSQKSSSKRRLHNMPNYTNEELYKWIIGQDNFQDLYDKWVLSGYDKMQVPSVDRKDDKKPYTIDNIQLTDWITNKSKLHTDLISGKYICKHKKVLQYNKNMNLINEFFSLSEAHRLTGALISKISLVCNLKRKSHLGFIWRFSD